MAIIMPEIPSTAAVIRMPLVEVEAIRWPHKVYYQNSIQMMTLAQFKRIA